MHGKERRWTVVGPFVLGWRVERRETITNSAAREAEASQRSALQSCAASAALWISSARA